MGGLTSQVLLMIAKDSLESLVVFWGLDVLWKHSNWVKSFHNTRAGDLPVGKCDLKQAGNLDYRFKYGPDIRGGVLAGLVNGLGSDVVRFLDGTVGYEGSLPKYTGVIWVGRIGYYR